VRWSSHPLATAIVAALGRPLTTPSANPAGEGPPTTLEQAKEYFGDGVDLYVDGGALAGGAGSTVVDPGPPLRILRPGVITAEALAEKE
jgi:L-threonylcarbamoyladenylate synthase